MPGVSRGHDDHRLLAVAWRPSGSVLPITISSLAARVGRAAGPPLAAVDDVLVAVADDARLDVGRVAARHRRLGHGERRADLAVEQRLQPLLLLLLGAEQVQQLHVAGVGRRAVDRLRGELVAPAGQLGERGVLELGQPGLRGQEEVPQSRACGPRPSAPRPPAARCGRRRPRSAR